MNQFDFRGTARKACHHCKVLWKGFSRTVYGAGIAGLMGMAAYGFYMIPTEDGYVAVCDFIGAVATLVVALSCMYAFGGCRKKTRYAAKG